MNLLSKIAPLLLLAMPFFTLAQIVPEDVILQLSPQIPGPNQVVDAEISSFSFDLDSSDITWYVNGVITNQQTGLKQIQFRTGAPGTPVSLRAVINTRDREVVEKRISFTPAHVDLLYQADSSFVPPFYQGKALNGHESGVTVVALPHFVNTSGSVAAAETLVYTWRIGNQIQTEDSGYGKDTFNFIGPSIYRNKDISVEVKNLNGDQVAKRSLELTAYQPQIIFYKTDPLLGTNLARAVSGNNIYFPQNEIALKAVPYFMADTENQSRTEYEWKINGDRFITIGDRSEINLSKTIGQSGKSDVSLEIKNVYRLLQYAKNSFSVLFGDLAPQINGSVQADYFGESL